MSDQETSEVDGPLRWLLVGFVVVMLLAIGIAAFLLRPRAAESVCSNTEARCGDRSDVGAP